MTDILIVEDNRELSDLLSDFLTAEGYSVLQALDGEASLSAIAKEEIRLIVLDIMLPHMDGFAVCQKIREERDVPILIVSAKSDKEDKLNGLLLGADDYIEKPYDIDILLAKIGGIFKRRYENNVLCDGALRLDVANRSASLADKPLSLTTKEFDLLVLLVENKGKTLQKEWIFNRIWGLDSFSEPQTLTVHIKWLREKIEEDPKKPKRIQTVWGVGYRFV